jgi:D-xylose transport system ATP-binding protein
MLEQASETLGWLGSALPDFEAVVSSLSGGQRQAIAIARAALWGSSIVLLDEPTAALGVKQAKMVQELIRQLANEGVAVLLISHNLQDVFAIADAITVMRLGETVEVFNTSKVKPDQVVAAITGLSNAGSNKLEKGQA